LRFAACYFNFFNLLLANHKVSPIIRVGLSEKPPIQALRPTYLYPFCKQAVISHTFAELATPKSDERDPQLKKEVKYGS